MSSQEKNTSAEQKFKDTPAGKIPVDWDVATFKESFYFLRTANNSRADLSDTGPVGYLHYGDIHTKWRTILKCDQEVFPKVTKRMAAGIPTLQNGDLVMADASEDYEGVGVSVEISDIGKQQIISGLHTILLRDKGNRFADGFRGYIQYIPAVRQRMIKVATGVSVYSISKGQLYDVAIPRPPIREQKKIYKILASADEAIVRTQKIIEQTQRLKNSLMQEFFIRGLSAKQKKIPIRSLLLFCQYGLNKPLTEDSSGVAVLRMNNLFAGNIDTQNLKYTKLTSEEEKEYLLKDGDILFNRTNSRALVGKVALFSGKAKIAFASYLLRLRVNPKTANSAWLNYYLNSPLIQSTLRSMATPGVSQSNINAQSMQTIKLNVPDLKTQEKAAGLLRALDERIEAETKKRIMLEETKLSLSQVLLTGKVRVEMGGK